MQSEFNRVDADPTTPVSPGPLTPWVDIALRAMDTGVTTSQNLMDGVDRLARAGANSELAGEAQPFTPAVWSGAKAALACSMALATAVQRSSVALLTQGWRQWLTTMGAMTAFAVRPDTFAPRSLGEAWSAATRASMGAPASASGRRSETGPSRAFGEHAVASASPKRRPTHRNGARRRR